MYIVYVSFMYIVDVSLLYIVNVSFKKILYFWVKVNINVDTAFQGYYNREKFGGGVTGGGGYGVICKSCRNPTICVDVNIHLDFDANPQFEGCRC
jgi:hypothetical protein